jgi:subtilisin family serine protease
MHVRFVRRLIGITLLVVMLGGTGFGSRTTAQISSTVPSSYIVQAATTDAAAAAVIRAGGTVKQPLALINGVSADLAPAAVSQLRAAGISVFADASVLRSDDTPTDQVTPNPNAADQANDAVEGSNSETYTRGYGLYPAVSTAANTVHRSVVTIPRQRCESVGNEWQVTAQRGTEQRLLQGRGVTVAVVDTGFMPMAQSSTWSQNKATGELFASEDGRCIVYRDFLPRTAENANIGRDARNSADQNGHGTHVVATLADRRATSLAPGARPSPVGVTPYSNLVIARALDKNGAGTYSTVISAIEWIVQNRTRYNIRVLNLSLYSLVSSPYWADPLGQAVMKAWQSGLVVVVAAGNSGPTAATITVPGNVPYVITVGSIKSGRYTESSFDELATYSSRGPTESAFVKPDLLVPASRIIAPMPTDSTLATNLNNMRAAHPEQCTVDGVLVPPAEATTGATASFCYQAFDKVDFGIGSPIRNHAYYQLSGTSMAAAEISGVAALILQANPNLNNNQIKQRLMSTARTAIDTSTGKLVYSPWEQGAGLLDTNASIFATSTDSANVGMNIALDLVTNTDPQTHYWGYTTWDQAAGKYQLVTPSGTQSWAGGTQSWAGGTQSWAGGTQSWAGGTQSWAGGTQSWAGSASLWAGGTQSWAGSIPSNSLNTSTFSQTVMNP